MSSNPEIIDLTSSSPSSSSPEEDLPPYPWELSDSDYEREMERRWDAHERRWNAHKKGEPSHVPFLLRENFSLPSYLPLMRTL